MKYRDRPRAFGSAGPRIRVGSARCDLDAPDAGWPERPHPVGMLVQVYLIAGVLFGEDWLELHRDLGKLVHLGYLLTFGAALLAAVPSWRWLLWPFVLATLGSTQAFLAGEFDVPLLAWGLDLAGDNGALHAFHGALVPLVFVTALVVARQALAALAIGGNAARPSAALGPDQKT
jgi:hypothetical protein